MATPVEEFAKALAHHAPEFAIELHDDDVQRLKTYYALLLKWNPRLHLVAPCSPEEFAVRHVLESLLLLKHLPHGASVVDVGSGGGLPMIPCLLLRDDLRATLIDSSQRKAVFLREALRAITPADRVRLKVGRFENSPAPEADFLSCRALDRFSEHLPTLITWSSRRTTFLLFAGESLRKQVQSLLPAVTVERIPRSERRFLIIARREN